MYGYQGKREGGVNWDTGIDVYTLVVVMSLLFNVLSRFVIVFLPGSKCLLISWLKYHCDKDIVGADLIL